jgi:hypothetical protein
MELFKKIECVPTVIFASIMLTSMFVGVISANPGDAMDMPVSDFSVSDAKVSEVINLLRTSYLVPVSFIEATSDQHVTFSIEKGTVRDVIEHVIAQSPEYRWMVVNERLVVYPDRPEYETTIVTGVDLAEIPRLDAARQYIDHLKSETEAFEKLSGVVMKGEPGSPVYATIVSMSTQAPVISHFVEILGADPYLVFSIQSTQTGYFVFFFEEIKTHPQKVLTDLKATPCCALSLTYANQQNLGCGAYCGAQIRYDITGVTTCPGQSCQGKSVTETVTTDQKCIPGPVHTGPCPDPIGPGNTISNCQDTFKLCAPAVDFPAGGCVETYTLTNYVGGNAVEICTITFTITKNGACSGTVTLSSPCTQLNKCCPDGSPNAGICYTPGTPEQGCCQYGTKCYDGNRDPEECRVCYAGTWHKGYKCKEGKCIPEFTTIAIPVAAILGLLFLFSRRRRKP